LGGLHHLVSNWLTQEGSIKLRTHIYSGETAIRLCCEYPKKMTEPTNTIAEISITAVQIQTLRLVSSRSFFCIFIRFPPFYWVRILRPLLPTHFSIAINHEFFSTPMSLDVDLTFEIKVSSSILNNFKCITWVVRRN